MRASSRVGYAFIVAAAAALLAGCEHTGVQTLPNFAQPDGGRSWMAADAARSDLMYVTNLGTNQVNVYSYPQGIPKGTITTAGPHGMCTDKAGDVFVADNIRGKIVEFAHGGTSPIRTLDDSGYFRRVAPSIR